MSRNSKKKQIFKLLFLAVLSTMLAIAICSCGDEHEFSSDWKSDATSHWHEAICEHKELISNKEEHSFGEPQITVQASCEQAGVKIYTCTICSYQKQEEIPATGHASSVSYAYDENGHWHTASCEHTSYTSPKMAHSFGEGVITAPATCAQDGVKSYTCIDCGYVRSEKIPATAHTFSDEWDSNENGHWHVASCEHSEVLSAREAHTWDNGRVALKNTCFKSGVMVYTCTGCSYEKATELQQKTHDLGEDGRCILCGWIQESEGLQFTLNSDQSSYQLEGLGSFEGKDLSIPAYYKGLPVTSVKYNLLKNKVFDTVTIPHTIKGIGSGVFNNTGTDKTIGIVYFTGTASDWSQIGFSNETSNPMAKAAGAIFMEGSRVRDIEIVGVKEIRQYAFQGFNSLKTLTLGESVEVIGKRAFYNCGLTKINFAQESNMRSIGHTAFYGTKLVELVIPSYIETLETQCFGGISTLKRLDLGAIKEMQEYVFYYATGLEELVIPDTLTAIPDYAFKNCSSLKKITIPASVTSFGKDAFYGAEQNEVLVYEGTLEQWFNISFGYGPTGMKSFIVSGTELTEITIPSSVESLNAGPLVGMGAIKKIIIPATCKIVEEEALSFCVGVEELIIENGVESLGEYSLSGMESLKEITIPSSVTKIGYGCFAGCVALERMTLPFIGNDRNADASTDVKSFGAIFDEYGFGYGTLDEDSLEVEVNAFNSNIGSYTMPRKIKTIIFTGDILYDGAFEGTSIETIIFEGNITEIPRMAFMNCQKLKNVTIPSTVKTIGDYAFAGAFALEKIDLPSSLETIGNQVFWYCSALKSITIPASVNSIGNKAFADTGALEEIVFEQPSGWWFSDTADAENGTEIALDVPTENITKLRDVYVVGEDETAPTIYLKRTISE